MAHRDRRPAYDRRQVLSLAGAAGLGAGLAACNVQTSSDQPGNEDTGKEPKPGGTTGPTPTISLPPSQADLPDEEVTFGVMTSGGLKAPFFTATFDAYHEQNPNVKIDYMESTWDRINEVVPIGIRNGTAPDIFQMPQTVPVQVAVNQGWVAPLEDVVPDFEEWKARFPETAFIPGVHVFNGKTYSWTFTSSRSQYSQLLLYDTKYLDKAGVDPQSERFTWDTFRSTARKITKQGDGQYYGLMATGEGIGGIAMNLAELAGLRGGDFDYLTGEFNYTGPELKAAIELMLAMKSDGSIFPGAVSLTSAEARSRMPQRVAALEFDGPWAIMEWHDTSPSYSFKVAMPPTRKSGTMHHVGYHEGIAAPLFVYAKSKYKGIAGDLLNYMGSVEGQTMLGILTNGIYFSEIEKVNKRVKKSGLLTPAAAQAGKVASALRRVVPLPQVRNPDVAKVILEQKAVKPTFGDIVEGIFTGQVKDIDKALQGLQDDHDKSLDDAIAAARKKGAQVSRDDWVFPNWDPDQDYTAADYK